jgi:ketosteroid isomerase-like protein
MARSDTDVVCGSHEAFRRRDLDAFVDHMDPEVEFTSLILEVEGTYRGHDGIRSWWNEVLAVFPDWQPQVEDARAVGDRVLLRIRAEGEGTGSGIGLDRMIWQVAEVRDGRLTGWKFFRSEHDAAAAAAMGG